MAEEGWCIQPALNPGGFWSPWLMTGGQYTVRQLQSPLSSWNGLGKWLWACSVSSAPRCAAFHTGRGAAQSGAQRTAHRHQLLSRLRLTVQHGSGKGEIGHQHNYGRRRVQQIDRTHSVEEGEGVRGGAGPRSTRHQRALEGKKARTLCGTAL